MDTIKAPKRPCPFLNEEGLCDIHDTKPKVCRDYPFGPEGYKTCPHLEEPDPRKARRIKGDQTRDFQLMADTRHTLLRKLIEGRRGQFGC